MAKILALGLAFAGLWAQSALAFPVDLTYVLLPTNNSYTAPDYIARMFYIDTNARWTEITSNGNWYASGEKISDLPNDDQYVMFLRVKDYYKPADLHLTYTNAQPILTNYYEPYSNSLAVTVVGVTTTNAVWTLAGPPEFTNATSYRTTFSNTYTVPVIPTGNYTVSFLPVVGHTLVSASPQSTNIVGSSPLVNGLTGTYTRQTGTIQVNVSPTNGSWAFTSYPSDFTNFSSSALSGTNNATLTNAPVGSYTIQFLPTIGYDLPTPSVVTKTNSSLLTTTFEGIYTAGWRLTVHVITPADTNLTGLGSGSWSVSPPNAGVFDGNESWYFSKSMNPEITILGIPAALSFFFKWAGDIGGMAPNNNPLVVTMNQNRNIQLYFSRAWNTNDNIGDIDGDGLPDVWELANGLNPMSNRGNDGEAGNEDLDFIPRSGLNPPMLVRTETNLLFIGENDNAGYPLLRNRLLSLGQAYYLPSSLGYANGVPFNNFLECRGLDGWYLTNTPPGLVYASPYGDDPMTDPKDPDTDGDEMTDGWEYYFWYWRSANAYATGITNSANLDWVLISPSMLRYNSPHDSSYDTDSDADINTGNDLDEFKRGTDPTHADTDGDGMDDQWEINNITPSAVSNALDYLNWKLNPDNDFYAVASNLLLLTTGMGGTAFTNTVCYTGAATNPLGVWINIYTNTGSNVFDLYRDTIIKADVALTNRQTGAIFANTVYYGISNGVGVFQQGYPVWVDVNGNTNFDAGDAAIINPAVKGVAVYTMAPASPFPGVTSFDPRTAWTHTNAVSSDAVEHPNTAAYNHYQEYLGGDYLGRVSWDAGGRVTLVNDSDFAMIPAHFTNPNNADTDGDTMEDGWEYYVGLNPNDPADAGLDPDGDTLVNRDEWANVNRTYANADATVGPSDPGVVLAPSPNDPHPKDTDWDGLGDNLEKTGSNPTCFDTDADNMPDGWETYAFTSVTNADDAADLDGDGLDNFLEYWTGTVPEWQYCDAKWAGVPASGGWKGGVCFVTRKIMPWDNPKGKDYQKYFIPPDFLSDASFIYYNQITTNLDWLRINFPAIKAVDDKYEKNYLQYHTTLANNPDSDGDGMDDFWEAYHGLNPCKGVFDMMMPGPEAGDERWSSYWDVDDVDADPSAPGFQFGIRPEWGGGVFNSIADLVNFVNSDSNRFFAIASIVGPFNFGLERMDPDGDGLPNLEEYAYSPNRTFYHTDPSPIWRTDGGDENSFVNLNYTWDYFDVVGSPTMHLPFPFEYEETEGFDTDNDGVGDYAEVNAAAGQLGNNPLDERNPIRNRALCLNGTNDFARTMASWVTVSETFLTRFCVEAWVKPDNPALLIEQVVVEKAGLYRNPYNPAIPIVGANFRLGLTNGLPYVLYNGRGSLRAHQATAQIGHRLSAGVWTHIAGTYDGAWLTVYVNGEVSMSLGTTELPATGVDSAFSTAETNIFNTGHGHSIIVGARDTTLTTNWPAIVGASNNFGGCIDEVRVWDGARSQAEIISAKNRRIQRAEMTNSPLVHYYSFDDVPDPFHTNSSPIFNGQVAPYYDEPVAPYYLTQLDTAMSFHPPISWWATFTQHSTVYSGLNGSYNYIVSAADHVKHMSVTPPFDDHYHFSSNFLGTNGMSSISDYNNFANPYGAYNLWGGIINMDLILCMGARGAATNSWLPGLDPDDPDSTDSDGDGLPDWWEQKYGLDPLDPNGVNGAWGDPDNDGLNNRAEYLAGTSPRNSDTFGTGIGDYDSPRGIYSRTYGEMYTDGDGMADDWEVQNGLDPQKYDANLDLDGDGWSNYAEYQAGSDPNNKYSYPQPLVFGVANYYGNKSGMLRFYAYETNTMDGVPQITKIGTDSLVAEVVGQANGTFIFTGRLPIAPIDVTTVVRISSSLSNGMFITFTFTGPGDYTYSGSGSDYGANLDYVTGRFTLRWASAEVPPLGANVSVEYSFVNRNAAAFWLAGFKEGEFNMLSLMDMNNSETYNSGEPMGIMEDQPVYLSYSSILGIRVLLTDERPGFGRFAWAASSTVTSAYPVVINRLSESGAPTILQRAMGYPRNYFHEWDFQLAGIEGLTAGTYQWWVGTQKGTFAINWPSSLVQPELVYPRGDTLYYARNQFAWIMDLNCPMAHMQIARKASDGSLPLVTDKYVRIPWMDDKYVFHRWLDDYAGDWGNGIYYWRVAGWTPQGESAWSDPQSFEVDLTSTNSRWITGDILYFGKVPATNIIVEAYDNRGFGGRPMARLQLTPPVTTNWIKCHYTMRGLEQGAYYVRAFIDTTPEASLTPRTGKVESWKSRGFYRDPNNFYRAGLVNVADVQFMDGVKIVIRDGDTDNDELPDAWEMAYFGNLDQTGDMDYDGDGESNLDEYIRDGVNMNPAAWDSDGDGLSDEFELNYNGIAFGFAVGPKAYGLTLNPTAWDTDGDGYSDGAELMRYHTDPMNPAGYPRYLPLCTDAWPSPGDFDGDGRSDVGLYDYNFGVWCLVTMYGQSYSLPFGITQVQPLVGDFDGDGRSDFTFYDPAQGIWTVYLQSGLSGSLKFGDASMTPVPADYNGDGRAELAVYDTNTGIWYIFNVWDGQLYTVAFGSKLTVPVPGDYNNDGAADLAVYEPATGNWMFGCYHKYYHTWQFYSGVFGGPTWTPVPGDYDGDGRNDACLFESATGRWQLLTWGGQFMQGVFGWAGCVPVPGDYDGDGRTDAAVYDTYTGMWYITCWSGAYYQGHFGWAGAGPIVQGR